MKRETIYQRLRNIGCTVDTSDAMAEVLEVYRDNKIEAFIMWAMGYTWKEVCQHSHISRKTLHNMIKKVNMETTHMLKVYKIVGDE